MLGAHEGGGLSKKVLFYDVALIKTKSKIQNAFCLKIVCKIG
jgi:hypothetical protein